MNETETETAILAGGCFWGMQELFRKLHGVISTKAGYTGGDLENPTYKEICNGNSGHAESIEVVFNPDEISYRDILKFFFKIHDPTTLNQQGNDIGSQYRSAVFASTEGQLLEAKELITVLDKSKIWQAPIVTEVKPAGPFYIAEEEHQDYLQKYPNGYSCHFIREGLSLNEV
jgi:peptide-methionine (S)-S-oxide reductase